MYFFFMSEGILLTDQVRLIIRNTLMGYYDSAEFFCCHSPGLMHSVENVLKSDTIYDNPTNIS